MQPGKVISLCDEYGDYLLQDYVSPKPDHNNRAHLCIFSRFKDSLAMHIIRERWIRTVSGIAPSSYASYSNCHSEPMEYDFDEDSLVIRIIRQKWAMPPETFVPPPRCPRSGIIVTHQSGKSSAEEAYRRWVLHVSSRTEDLSQPEEPLYDSHNSTKTSNSYFLGSSRLIEPFFCYCLHPNPLLTIDLVILTSKDLLG
jgi:hypothetical protein